MKYLLVPVFLMMFVVASSQNHYRYSVKEDMLHTPDVSGGNASGQGGSISYSVGQVFYTVSSSYEYVVLEGVQQPESQSRNTTYNKPQNIFITAYPNPFTDFLFIEVDDIENKNLQYVLFDIQGNLLIKDRIKETTTKINLYHLQAAVYFLKVVNGHQNITTFKLIKK